MTNTLETSIRFALELRNKGVSEGFFFNFKHHE